MYNGYANKLEDIVKSKMLFTGLIALVIIIASTTPRADEVAVTVYNSNLGVISETRTLTFEKGIHNLAYRDVPSQIDPASVRFTVDGGKSVAILEQNFAYDLVSPDKVFEKYIDSDVDLVGEDDAIFSGKLLAFGGGYLTLQEDDGKIRMVSSGKVSDVTFPSLPEGLITRPTLFWLYNSTQQGSLKTTVGYQTSGLNWSAEYVGTLNADENKIDLAGWSSIDNNSGKTYKDATLKLIAGDIHRADQPMIRGGRAEKFSMTAEAADSYGFEEKAFFEYHMYTLPRKATVADRETKQISLFDPASTAVTKIFSYRPDRNQTDVNVAVKFANRADAGLGMPLPAGRVRIFKADTDGSLILLGEDRIKHTPRDEEMKLTVGTAFDVKAELRMMDQRNISKYVNEYDYEIEIRNRKTEAITVNVEKNLYGNWTIKSSTLPYKKKDISTVTFDVHAKAGETVVLKMTVSINSR